jgi:hypothetical protein
MDRHEYLNILSRVVSLVDVVIPRQTGLAMRCGVFENCNTKVATNNV